jgi:hypothetical protein
MYVDSSITIQKPLLALSNRRFLLPPAAVASVTALIV